jgi:3'(2'), 5'-bisphosphate nucleotidase
MQSLIISETDIDFVSDLARVAGEKALIMREGVEIKEKTGPTDLVTAADCALSGMLTKALKERFPDDVIVSEEDDDHARSNWTGRVWLIDPIDGTDNYVKNDGQYCVMIGLLDGLKPIFGWVYVPAEGTIYYGGPSYGAFRKSGKESATKFTAATAWEEGARTRLLMGRRDRKSHPWVADLQHVDWLVVGSIGLKVMRILSGDADVFVHLSGKLKAWDTAGPVAIAYGGGLEIGSMEDDGITFPLPDIRHEEVVIIGRPGSLAWARTLIKPQLT